MTVRPAPDNMTAGRSRGPRGNDRAAALLPETYKIRCSIIDDPGAEIS